MRLIQAMTSVYVVMVFLATPAIAKHLHLERWYQKRWCDRAGGIMEYRLSDGARVDCLTDEYAIEFDFARKWAESVGQALYYANQTGRKPGIVLIMERGEKDIRFLRRLNKAVEGLTITIWVVKDDFIGHKTTALNTN